MTDNKPEKKYEKVDSKIAPVVIDRSDKTRLVLVYSATKRLTDNNIYQGISLIRGYNGTFGFQRNKVNGSVELPADLTDEELNSIFKAYQQIRDQAKA